MKLMRQGSEKPFYKKVVEKNDKISRDILERKSGYLVIADVSQISLKS